MKFAIVKPEKEQPDVPQPVGINKCRFGEVYEHVTEDGSTGDEVKIYDLRLCVSVPGHTAMVSLASGESCNHNNQREEHCAYAGTKMYLHRPDVKIILQED